MLSNIYKVYIFDVQSLLSPSDAQFSELNCSSFSHIVLHKERSVHCKLLYLQEHLRDEQFPLH